MRKKRTDRNHVIYKITCITTGDTYIGLTVAKGRAFQKSAKDRLRKHFYRALIEKADLPISQLIRSEGIGSFKTEVLEIIRGKSNAHLRESELISLNNPSLNVLCVKNENPCSQSC